MSDIKIRGTTIVAVRKGNKGVIAGDGQVTANNTIIKSSGSKIKRINKDVISGFAGSVADAMTLLDRLANNLSKYSNLQQACLAMAKDWRTDKYLRRLEAMMVVMDKVSMFILTGDGNVMVPEYGIASIGSGSSFALAAAHAYSEHIDDSTEIATKALKIAARYCIYTNDYVSREEIDIEQ